MFGDEIAIRAPDAGPRRGQSGGGHARRDRVRDGGQEPGGARRDRADDSSRPPRSGSVYNFTSGCEVADDARAAARLRPRRAGGAALHVRAVERQRPSQSCEGRGDPAADARRASEPGHGGDRAASSRPITPSTQRATAATARTTRRSPTCSSRTAANGSIGSGQIEPWDAVLALEPEPHRMLDGDDLDDALTVAADFIDLKSPYMGGHSRRCAELAADAARVLGFTDEAIAHAPPRGARARLRHHRGAELDLGQARLAHAHGVRSGRAAPDADRADAAPLTGAGRAESRRVPPTTRSAMDPVTTSACVATPATPARACWRRRRSTWG